VFGNFSNESAADGMRSKSRESIVAPWLSMIINLAGEVQAFVFRKTYAKLD
jgi:hypothetical protein